jgi:hypothetical protein
MPHLADEKEHVVKENKHLNELGKIREKTARTLTRTISIFYYLTKLLVARDITAMLQLFIQH